MYKADKYAVLLSLFSGPRMSRNVATSSGEARRDKVSEV
jgi:hypothetical protein